MGDNILIRKLHRLCRLENHTDVGFRKYLTNSNKIEANREIIMWGGGAHNHNRYIRTGITWKRCVNFLKLETIETLGKEGVCIIVCANRAASP